jgi:sugar/nucleoside kinase (ribokinase family)
LPGSNPGGHPGENSGGNPAGNRPRVLVIGDVINDILVETRGPLVEGADNPAEIRSRPGGSAANQAAWMGHLGLDVVFAGRVGEADAELHRAELARFGVDAQLAADESAGTGSVVVLVGADGERTMITDRGANLRLVPPDVPFGLLDGAALLHLTGYTLVDPGPRPVALELIAQARRRGVPVSVDPGSSAFLARLAPGDFVRWTAGAAICFPNRDEAGVLTGETDPVQMAIALSAHYGAVAVKLAADGAVLAARRAGRAVGAGRAGRYRDPPERFPALPAVVRDTTGAGDAFCAGFLAAWLVGAGLAGAMSAAAQAAAVAVAALGGRPEPGQRTPTRVPRSVPG